MAMQSHRLAEELMAQADLALMRGKPQVAETLLATAAQAEASACLAAPVEKARTRGILAVSAVELFKRAGLREEAQRCAELLLAQAGLPKSARVHLQELVASPVEPRTLPATDPRRVMAASTLAARPDPIAPDHATFVNLRDPARALSPDGRPAASRRAPIWREVPDDRWNDWRWQLSNRVNTAEEIGRVLNLTDDERTGLSSPDKVRVDITPYFLSLIDPDDPNDPIRRQVIPTAVEHDAFTAMTESLSKVPYSPVPGLVHRYPDRVLMQVTTQCASYCRFCTCSRIVGDSSQNFNRAELEAQLEYLRQTPQVRDVLISGGDALTLAPKLLESIIRGIREIPHIEIIRIGSRVPVFLPQHIDDELCDMLSKYHPLWMNLHFNHPNEITPEVSRACDRLARAGIPLGNQSVLLAGVNDCVHVMRALVHRLVENRVRPYYVYQCDLVEGSGHFRTPVGKGIEIMEGLRGHTSGYAVPTYVVDAPGGGKIPVMPNYLISYSDHKIVLRNFEGYITTYEEPAQYTPHDQANCRFCQHPRAEPGQAGVAGLLKGEQLWIEPADFEQTHSRSSESPHGSQDPGKWVPYGVGPTEGTAGGPFPELEPSSNAYAPEAGPRTPAEPQAEYGPGEEPRPREGTPTGWHRGDLL
jgi:lysine 2,3-aminomutase